MVADPEWLTRVLVPSDDPAKFKPAPGGEALATFLSEEAATYQEWGFARVFVALGDSQRIDGYYTLSMGSRKADEFADARPPIFPKMIPVIVLGKLARHCDRPGFGEELLTEALQRAAAAAQHVGAAGVSLVALNKSLEKWYAGFGFARVQGNSNGSVLMFMGMQRLGEALQASAEGGEA